MIICDSFPILRQLDVEFLRVCEGSMRVGCHIHDVRMDCVPFRFGVALFTKITEV